MHHEASQSRMSSAVDFSQWESKFLCSLSMQIPDEFYLKTIKANCSALKHTGLLQTAQSVCISDT